MAIDRDIMRGRDVAVDPQQREMPRRFRVPPQQTPKGVPMPDRRFDFRRDMPMPTPMPSPDRRFDFRRDMPMPTPMPSPMPPPGMGPFRQEPFLDMMPRDRRGIEELMPNLMERMPLPLDFVPEYEAPRLPRDFEVGPMQPVAAKIDPSDYRTIIKMIEQGLDPDDYMNRGGIASLLQQYGIFK